MLIRKHRQTFALLLGLCSTASWLMAEEAQPAPTQDVVELDNIDVQGSSPRQVPVGALRSSTLLRDTPQSVTVFTEEQIANQGFTQIGDLIDYTPGVNTSQGEGHRDAVVFRGVRSTADFFVDGVRDDVQYYRPLYNVEQVEILRGPNALLFGRGAPGGLINRVMKKGSLGENFNDYQTRIDSFGAASIQVDSNTAVSDRSAFRLNFFYESLANHRDFYEGERWGINPTYRIALAESTLLDLSYEYLNHERFIDRGIPTGSNGEPVGAFKDIVFGDPELNESTLEAHVVTARIQHQFSEAVRGNLTAFYGSYDKFYGNFYASGYNQASTPNQVTLDGYEDTTNRDNLVFSGDLNADFETGSIQHKILTGAEFINTSSDQDRYNAFWNTTQDDNEIFNVQRPLSLIGGVGVNAAGQPTQNDFRADINDDTRVDVETASFFIQDEIVLFEGLNLVLGARYDNFDISVNNVVADDKRSRTDDEISPRLGLIYKPQEEISIYASYSETFLPRSGEQYANINGDRDSLSPDEFVNLEGGVKWDMLENLSVSAAIFQIQRTTAEVDDADSANFVEIESETTGFEAELQGMLTANWYILAGYSYLDGEQVDQDGDTGLRPRELPENMFSIWNHYRVNENFGFGLGLVVQDESYINNSNSATLPSYARVDASVFYNVRKDLRVQLNVENLFDEVYYPDAHSTHQATVGEPMNATLSIRGRL